MALLGKEITEKFLKKRCAICMSCGRIFEKAKTLNLACPVCEAPRPFLWVLNNRLPGEFAEIARVTINRIRG